MNSKPDLVIVLVLIFFFSVLLSSIAIAPLSAKKEAVPANFGVIAAKPQAAQKGLIK